MSKDAHSQAQKTHMEGTFADRLSSALRSAGKSPYQLAKALDVAHTTVTRWLGGAKPLADMVPRIAAELRVDEKWLLSGTGLPTESVSDTQQRVQEGPRGAARRMSDAELIAGIVKHALELQRETWKARFFAEIIRQFCDELLTRIAHEDSQISRIPSPTEEPFPAAKVPTGVASPAPEDADKKARGGR